jgi:hypothetical protein
MDVRPNSDSVTARRFRTAVNPLRCAIRASRKPRANVLVRPYNACVAPMDAAGKTFWAFAILHRPESRWCANPWQTPLVACDESMRTAKERRTHQYHRLELRRSWQRLRVESDPRCP